MIIRGVCGFTLRVKLTCADPEYMLSIITSKGYVLRDVLFEDPLSVCFTVNRLEFESICDIAVKEGSQLKIQGAAGIYLKALTLFRRPVLVLGVALLVFLSVFLSGRVLFVSVLGNENVPTDLILRRAENVGIYFGALRREVRSERVKNELLQSLPQLQWVGVNTVGCTATIMVEERAVYDENVDKGLSHIVAGSDAIIHSCTIANGVQLCRVGQAVKEGDILVSAYTDCGNLIKLTGADAEVYGMTSRELTIISPDSAEKRGTLLRTEVDYYLQIGKNIIKFNKDSGIWDASCVKMYSGKTLALPGGFELPVSVGREVRQYYQLDSASAESSEASWLSDFAEDYLKSHMIAGRILKESTAVQRTNGAWVLDGTYVCLESIGRKLSEEILHRNE